MLVCCRVVHFTDENGPPTHRHNREDLLNFNPDPRGVMR